MKKPWALLMWVKLDSMSSLFFEQNRHSLISKGSGSHSSSTTMGVSASGSSAGDGLGKVCSSGDGWTGAWTAALSEAAFSRCLLERTWQLYEFSVVNCFLHTRQTFVVLLSGSAANDCWARTFSLNSSAVTVGSSATFRFKLYLCQSVL